MAATLRELRGRIKSASSIKKITKAQELIATSRIAKAQARVDAARPYATEITNMLTELAGASALDHPLLVERENPRRAGVLVVSSDRGLCGGYNANVLRRAEELFTLLRNEGKEPVLYVVGRKALGYYSFRQRTVTESWIGFSERPSYEDAKTIADTLVATFLAGEDDEGDACFVEGFNEGLFEGLAAVELLAVDADGFDAGFFGAREGVGVGLVGQDKGDCRIYFTAADGIDDGLEVGAAAGAQHA